jgi:acyl-coenzyme A synthetase/AMP-(fatty) acid ligase
LLSLGSRASAEARGELAYLCYTSGTTGAARGAPIPHAGVRGLASHEVGQLRRRADDFKRQRVVDAGLVLGAAAGISRFDPLLAGLAI